MDDIEIRKELSRFEEAVDLYKIDPDDVDDFRRLEREITSKYPSGHAFNQLLQKIKTNPNYNLEDAIESTPEEIARRERYEAEGLMARQKEDQQFNADQQRRLEKSSGDYESFEAKQNNMATMARCERLENFVRNEAAKHIEADFGEANLRDYPIFYEFKQFVVNPYLTSDDFAKFCQLWGPYTRDKVLIVYHGTKNNFRDQILQSRYLKIGRALHGSGVYSTTDAFTALDYNANPKINGGFQLLVCIALTNPGFLSDEASTPDKLDQERPSIPRPTNYVISKREGTILPIGVVNYTYRNKTQVEEDKIHAMPLSENINGVMIQTSPSQSVSKNLGGRRSRRKIRKSRRKLRKSRRR